MSLQQRIKKIEQQTAPMKAEQEHLRESRESRAAILAILKNRIEDALSLSRYVHGDVPDEEEGIKDIVELSLMYEREAAKRFGVDESNRFKATTEQLKEINREVAKRFNLRFFNYSQTVEQFDKTDEQWTQARADRAAGVDSAESEACEYLRQLVKRYPRNQNAKRFYLIWE
jgi:hypothetical protein